MHALLALAFATFTVHATVVDPADPLEVTETEVLCTPFSSTVDVCTITDGLTWIEVLRCDSRVKQCVTVEKYDLW